MTEHAVATNAAAIRNLAARLEAWGLTDAHKRAEFIALNLLAEGYRPLEPPPALHGPTSTAAGRKRAREIWEASRREKATE